MTDQRTALLLILALLGLAGCSGYASRLTGNIPRQGTTIPNSTLMLSPSVAVPLEKVVFWGAYAGTAYSILDPLAPNWEIEEARFPNNQIHLSLKMRRYYAGGAGEARVAFHRRARELVQYGGFEGYEVLEYNEGLESSVLGSQRVTEGVVRLTGLGIETAPVQGNPPPARMTPASASNPRS
ncbi:MAG: hypothetical protein HY847_02090 [Betaproteobacteria bacterium]|nr:hypothetical protein [Betaproteobacteria bacterium]